jgi:PAS domain S-box-containing protein
LEQDLTTFSYQKEDRFRKLIEGLNVITYEFDLSEHRFIYVSRQAENILGYGSSQWLENGFWYNHLHNDDKKWAKEFSNSRTAELKDHEFEYRMVASDGTVKWFKDITSVVTEEGAAKSLQGVLIDITDRRKMESELRENKERYRALVEEQTEMITRWKPDGTFTYVNDVFCDFFGKTRRELIGKTYIPEMPVEDLERFTKFFMQLDKDNPIGTFTHRVIMPSGVMRWLSWTDRAIFDNSGNIAEYQTVGRDITAMKNAEDALRKSEEELQIIFENTPIGMSLNTLDGKFIKVNNAYCKIIGYSREELCKMTFKEITHSEDLPGNLDLLNKALERGDDTYELEKRYVTKNNEIVYVSIHVTVLKNSAGKPHQLIAQIIDITDKKLAEAKLQETQTRLTAVLNHLPNVVFYENAVEKQFISPNILEMLGHTADDFYKDPKLFDSLIHPEDIDKVIKGYDNWRKSGARGTYRELFRIKRKDGNYIWLEDHMFYVKKPDGKSYVLGVMIDITEQKNIEEKMASSLMEKELLLKEIHHRVKNNLQVVSSLLKLHAGSVNDNKSHDILLDSRNRVRSMALVHQKLYQSKDFSQIDFTEYISQLTENLFDAYQHKNINIDLSIKTDEAKLSIDIAIPCGLIINELVTNSLKYAFPNGKPGKVEIELTNIRNNHYELMIKDNGVGFPSGVDFKNSTSLGLQLVNTLVGQIDGEIEMENHEGTAYKIKFANNPYRFTS